MPFGVAGEHIFFRQSYYLNREHYLSRMRATVDGTSLQSESCQEQVPRRGRTAKGKPRRWRRTDLDTKRVVVASEAPMAQEKESASRSCPFCDQTFELSQFIRLSQVSRRSQRTPLEEHVIADHHKLKLLKGSKVFWIDEAEIKKKQTESEV